MKTLISNACLFFFQLLGQTQEALEAYTDIINRKIADVSSIAVATNNLIAVKGTKDISDGLRKLDQLVKKDDGRQHFQMANGLDFKLFARQKEAIYSNRVLLLLHANKLDQVCFEIYFCHFFPTEIWSKVFPIGLDCWMGSEFNVL